MGTSELKRPTMTLEAKPGSIYVSRKLQRSFDVRGFSNVGPSNHPKFVVFRGNHLCLALHMLTFNQLNANPFNHFI
jgi:hypothetical protein